MTEEELTNQEEEEEEEEVEVEPTTVETDIDIEDETRETIDTPIYEFHFTERTNPDYTISTAISEWLVTNLSSITDDDDNEVFSKVNTGYNENTLKTFGKKPVCDVYINRIEYDGNFDNHPPVKVHTIILFYMKGANNHTYMQCCAIHDHIMQQFLDNETFRRLEDVVRDTQILNSELRIQPLNKKWGVMGAFELSHQLY